MTNLIKALQIFLKYGDPAYPTHCEHDVMHICGIDPVDVSAEDIAALDELGFDIDSSTGQFYSFHYGSA